MEPRSPNAEKAPPPPADPSISWVLGTPLLLTTYPDLIARCRRLPQSQGARAIEFTNTQIVAMRRHLPEYRQQTNAYDYFIPDGMPLVWCLNRRGAQLPDRVYGPTFMRRFVQSAPAGSRHYLLGGSSACGERLRERFKTWNPRVEVSGSFHGVCGTDGILDGAEEPRINDELRRLDADFIWVGLGTPKQDAWVSRHKSLLPRGLVLSVGYAFDVNAGIKPDAPEWMQRRGLTWLFRFFQEPRRLGRRYLLFNSLFLAYLTWDLICGRAFSSSIPAVEESSCHRPS